VLVGQIGSIGHARSRYGALTLRGVGVSARGANSASGSVSLDPDLYELPSEEGSTHLGRLGEATVKLTDSEWRTKLSTNQYLVLRKKCTEPGHRLMFPLGFDDHVEKGTYLCAGCMAASAEQPLYSDAMKFDCGCGWPGFWTNVKGNVYEKRDEDGHRCEILCSACDGHLGHVFRGEGFGSPTDERHCVNSMSLVFQPAAGGILVVPSYTGAVHG